ncbi:DYW family of nucleic acid deaminases-domain-containing protein [Xylariomycetidae sp. FL2044]|nr:DYW family of nucleic acid deaminases-domain-containing protein [Xylariomycetidae sp. FL2044]
MPESTQNEPLAVAKVEWWNRSFVYVRCPFCENIHRHGLSGSYSNRLAHRRSSHCCPPPDPKEYCMQFPFDERTGAVAYEIDRKRALFVAGTADPTEYFSRLEDYEIPTSVLERVSEKRKWTEAGDLEINVDGEIVELDIAMVISEMLRGEIDSVRMYLSFAAEEDKDIFLHGVEAYEPVGLPTTETDNDALYVHKSGKTALHFAAREQSHEIVKLLLESGADPNAADLEARVPLMEAAFWGRLKNVKLLLEYGARRDMTCPKDGKHLRAIDFARSSERNAEERYRKSGGEAQFYKENTFKRDQDRKEIVRILSDEKDRADQERMRLGGAAFSISPQQNGFLTTLVTYFDIPNKWKTVGVLYRGDRFRTVAAMSGWTDWQDDHNNIRIESKVWTTEVLNLCEDIEHRLEEHQYDRGQRGRYHACHAEKQLIAYFVHKHLFTADETVEGCEFALGNLRIQECSDLGVLASVAPRIALKKATILVCRPVCADCDAFVQRINEALGLELTVVHSPGL